MAFWNCKQDEFEKMDALIRQQPGIRLVELARQLGVEPSTIMRRMPSLEEAGFHYWEDESGGLHPFESDTCRP